jgi:hypothetical protein
MVGRLTPKDIQDAAPYGATQQSNMAVAMEGANVDNANETGVLDAGTARSLAREAYQSSTDWLNASRRSRWNDSLRAFQGLHSNGSKYLSPDYHYRSRLYRPKTRAMIRKGEAETAAAFFSNEDVVSISANDDNDKNQQASAEINKRLVQYRLTKTIPWFLTLVGARQDADVMGVCIAKVFWKYTEVPTGQTNTRPKVDPETGMPIVGEDGNGEMETYDIMRKSEDHPWVDLIAPENFRIDPAADWRDPIATSPYVIHLLPMYVQDVRERMKNGDWLPVSDSALMGSNDTENDTTRRTRENGRIPGTDKPTSGPRDYDICWVAENVMRWGGQDWHYFTLASSGEVISPIRQISEVYLHGERPWVMGFIVPEAHKNYPSAKTELVRDLQTNANDVANLRLDNVKLALNPRQFVAPGTGADPNDLRTFMPGKVAMIKDPRNSITWDRPPEVTASSYEEQDRINTDFDELAGGMSNSSAAANPGVMQAVGTTEIMDGNANKMGEYELRVFAETFVEKVIRQLVKLEQAYETDQVVLTIAGHEAQLYQKFGVSQITDMLLQQELTTKVNVGIGATNPQIKLRNFGMAADMMAKMFGPALAQGVVFEEVCKEVFGLCGYKDGTRFFQPGFDPIKAMQEQAQANGKSGGAATDPGKMQAAQITTQGKMQEAKLKSDTDLQIAQMDLQKTMLQEQMETHRAEVNATREIATLPAHGVTPLPATHPLIAAMMGHNHAGQ